MGNVAEITIVKDRIICDKKGEASVDYTVRNILGAEGEFGVDFECTEPVQKAWLSATPKSWEAKINETVEDLTVTIKVPKTVASGEYVFKIRVYLIANGHEFYTESEAVTFSYTKSVEQQKVEPKTLVPPVEPTKSSLWNTIWKWVKEIFIFLFWAFVTVVITNISLKIINPTDPEPDDFPINPEDVLTIFIPLVWLFLIVKRHVLPRFRKNSTNQ